MNIPDLETLLSWRGRTVVDREGDKLGKLGALYLDDATDRPAFAGVRTGLLGTRESFVPLAGMQEDADGDVLRVPYDAALVRDAPSVDPDGGVLDPQDEEALEAHYAVQADRTYGTEEEGTMLRSEEEVRVSRGEMRPRERVRLRKVLVTEQEERTVPVRKEVVQLETEPPPSGRIESVEDVEER